MEQNNVTAFLQEVTAWAGTQLALHALALVGSHARGAAGPDSDVDLILLLEDPVFYLAERSWLYAFGEPLQVGLEDWGKVTSVRVYYASGLEVEFGLAGLDWGAEPHDPGDLAVIRDGIAVLFERDHHLSRKLEQINSGHSI